MCGAGNYKRDSKAVEWIRVGNWLGGKERGFLVWVIGQIKVMVSWSREYRIETNLMEDDNKSSFSSFGFEV